MRKPGDYYIVYPMCLEGIGTKARFVSEHDLRQECEAMDREVLSHHREAHPIIVVLRSRSHRRLPEEGEGLTFENDCVEIWYRGQRFVREDRRS